MAVDTAVTEVVRAGWVVTIPPKSFSATASTASEALAEFELPAVEDALADGVAAGDDGMTRGADEGFVTAVLCFPGAADFGSCRAVVAGFPGCFRNSGGIDQLICTLTFETLVPTLFLRGIKLRCAGPFASQTVRRA